VLEQAKTVRAIDHAATVIGNIFDYSHYLSLSGAESGEAASRQKFQYGKIHGVQ
jgi:hypothetical protein